MSTRKYRDMDGREVKAGDVIVFSYGIPPVVVRAPVIERDGRLIALTEGHNPSECPVSKLKKEVGDFWIVPPHLLRKADVKESTG